MSTELIITITMTVATLLVSVYNASSSAKKNTVDGLSVLVDKLEKRLKEEEDRNTRLEVELEKLRKGMEFRDKYIKVLINQLRNNGIIPVFMEEKEEQ